MPRKSKTVVTFAVTLQVPERATIQETAEYIRNALGSWKGSFKGCMDSESSMSELDTDTLRVALQKRVTEY